jgi:hypothetical protein
MFAAQFPLERLATVEKIAGPALTRPHMQRPAMTTRGSAMAITILSDEDVADFNEFGYLVLRNVLTPDEADHYRNVILGMIPPDLTIPKTMDGEIGPDQALSRRIRRPGNPPRPRGQRHLRHAESDTAALP